MKRAHLLCLGVLAVSLLAGCDGNQAEQQPAAHEHAAHTAYAPNGDLLETTASLDQLPSFLDHLDPQIVEAYKVAAANQDLLKTMPCYCGCGESAGHQHNGNCFIKEVNQDGSVVWDDHGTRCGTCMEIAVVSSQMKAEGKSAVEIRQFIDNAFKEGFAKPTPTPMPS
ncbi:PCYCGC motif-containing (lipo)protein [Brevibacillus fulvus]|uniref:Lipoprotein n=1 Tax=Brevibacillus fulvus TaxID=1125967 RepID=A0A939BU52_9BACL|nr:PCYCGC motif-containing (lipo)protein [Brevibacillus fulvus]MBM7592188.1 hypothetical protein [Brevibacillus fulvus]